MNLPFSIAVSGNIKVLVRFHQFVSLDLKYRASFRIAHNLCRLSLANPIDSIFSCTQHSFSFHSKLLTSTMPGYEQSRFVDASPKELNELLCMICQDVFCQPVVTSCCGQTFCESCIKSWIDSNHTCPFDFKPLRPDMLSPPPK